MEYASIYACIEGGSDKDKDIPPGLSVLAKKKKKKKKTSEICKWEEVIILHVFMLHSIIRNFIKKLWQITMIYRYSYLHCVGLV